MLTGEPPHTGTNAQAIIAKLMTTQAQPVHILRPSVPPNVAMAVERGLAKLPADRFGSARAFADALANQSYTAIDTAATTAPAPRRTNHLAWTLGALLLAPLAIAAWEWLEPEDAKPLLRYELALDSAAGLRQSAVFGGRIALSPDGAMLVYVGGPASGLMLRHRDQLEASLIPGTEQAGGPAFSPNGKRISFMQNGRTLMIATLDGSAPITVTDSLVSVTGMSWSGNDTLIVDGRGASPLVRVGAHAGAHPEFIAPLDSSLGEIEQFLPEVLPSGEVLYVMGRRGFSASIALLDPRSGERRVIVEGARSPRFAAGYLLYVTPDGTLMAVSFDPRRRTVSGTPVVVGVGLSRNLYTVDVAVAGNGTLAFVATNEGISDQELTWVTRQGKVEVFDTSWRGTLTDPSLSPDGTRLAVSDADDIWIRSLTSGARTRVSLQGGRNRFPLWTRDGKHLLYVSAGPVYAVIENPADGSVAPTRRVESRTEIGALGGIAATPDGEWLVYSLGGFSNPRLYAHRRGDSSSRRVLAEESPQMSPAFSPDGRFLAYTQFEGRLSTTYVMPFPNTDGRKWQVSPNPGLLPVWSNSGREIFYRDMVAGTLVAVPVTTGTSFSVGAPKVLFPVQGESTPYSVSRDDSRFLMVRPTGEAVVRNRLTIIENWVSGLSQTSRP
jgi:serine/threonine-protein kinase